jgi:protein-S-isoprenylcysteine O-methyltransferase Ste14
MQNSASSDFRIERAIYLVGGLVLFLWGFQSIVSSVLSIYDVLVPGPPPPASSHFWVDQSVMIFVELIILLAGLFLLSLAWRAHRRSRSGVPRDPKPL